MVTAMKKAFAKFMENRVASVDQTELMRVEKIEIKDPKDIQVRLLTGIPDIGITTSRAIINKVGSVSNLMKFTQKEMLDIDGVGKVTAKKIYDALHYGEAKG
jgi:ERCC4-type nuclease